jgi:outer membrane lipoprotein SlyB
MQKSLVLVLIPLVIALGCAKRPVLYPNEQYEQSGQEIAERNVSECLALAENAGLETNQAAEAGKRTAGGAVVGTATGAGIGALIGLTSGAIAGLFSWIFGSSEPDDVFVRYVDRCLADRGYESIGWK